MLPILASVVVISLSGAIAPGPMLAVTLSKGYRSPWAGLQVALGHAAIEVPLILLIAFGFASFLELPVVQVALSFVGGGMLIWLGVNMFRSRSDPAHGRDLPYNAFVSGILASGLNPFFIVWWATVGGMLIARILPFGAWGLASFTLAHWCCDALWYSLVSVFIFRSHSFWGQQFQQVFFIVCALFLGGFGIYFIVSGTGMIV